MSHEMTVIIPTDKSMSALASPILEMTKELEINFGLSLQERISRLDMLMRQLELPGDVSHIDVKLDGFTLDSLSSLRKDTAKTRLGLYFPEREFRDTGRQQSPFLPVTMLSELGISKYVEESLVQQGLCPGTIEEALVFLEGDLSNMITRLQYQGWIMLGSKVPHPEISDMMLVPTLFCLPGFRSVTLALRTVLDCHHLPSPVLHRRSCGLYLVSGQNSL